MTDLLATCLARGANGPPARPADGVNSINFETISASAATVRNPVQQLEFRRPVPDGNTCRLFL
jgi:hypothetical protein